MRFRERRRPILPPRAEQCNLRHEVLWSLGGFPSLSERWSYRLAGLSCKVLLVNRFGERWTRALSALCLAAGTAAADDGADFFEKRVRPVLARSCFACHSEAGNVAMGGLRLDSAEALAEGGARGPAVVAGKPGESLLVRAVQHTDEGLLMPPTGQTAGRGDCRASRVGEDGRALGGRGGGAGCGDVLVVRGAGGAGDSRRGRRELGALANRCVPAFETGSGRPEARTAGRQAHFAAPGDV